MPIKLSTCFFVEKISVILIDNLRSDYIENKQSGDVEEWPPNQPQTVVNVALIHCKDSQTKQELIKISKRIHHKESTPAVDKLAHHPRVITDISKIFQPDFTNSTENETESPKLILIEGAPGIGKTVLAKKIAYLWAKNELLVEIGILFLLFLRDPQLQNVKTPEQLIRQLSKHTLSEELATNCVTQIKKLQVGIVMDGFDEYPIKLRKKSLIVDIMQGKVFPNCTIVLTSRPSATIHLHSKVDLRVEILGFAQEERDEYISKSLESPEETEKLQEYLKCQPVINGLVYVPLHLAVLLYLFKDQSKLPETLTEMNELFILHTIYRSLTKNDLIPDHADTAVYSLKDLPQDVLDIIEGLCKLAFKALQDNQLVFSYKEIQAHCSEIEKDMPEAFNGFGLLQVVQHFPSSGYPGTAVSFNFLHFTMQEFLAALYVSDIAITPYEQQLSLMEETFWNSMYNFMWMMFVGINGINSQTFMQFIYKTQPGDDITKMKLSSNIKLDKVKCLHLFQCFMEAKCENIPKEISKIFYNREMNFYGLQLLPYHVSSLTLYISKYSMQLQSLDLRDCHIGDVGMSILKHYFTVNPEKASSIIHIDLFGNNSVLLWDVYCAIFGQQNLLKLNWSSLGGVSVEEIVTVMDKNTTVQSLNLSNNYFKNDDARRIAEALTSNATLKELDFSSNDINAKGALAISKCLCDNVKLQHIKISWSNHFIDTDSSTICLAKGHLENIDLEIVGNILCKNEIITKLDLSQHKISDNGIQVESISKCIESSRSVIEIDLSQNNISDSGIKKIAIALKSNQVVQKFDISRNKVSDDGVVAIIDCLKNNTTLQQLKISHNKISDGIIGIGEVLQMNKTLQVLDISNNTISDEGIIAIGKGLRNHHGDCSMVTTNEGEINEGNTQNCILKKLDISHNCISNEGILALSVYLKDNRILQELTISWNECKTPFTLDNKFCNMSGLYFRDAGTALVSAFLSRNLKIQNIDISFNDISDDGAVSISEYLEYNALLQELNISHNEITNDGIIKILGSINSNSSLCTLNVTHNVITKSGYMMICDIYEKLTNLSSFHVTYNEMVDNSQNIDTIIVHLDSKYVKKIDRATMKVSMQKRNATYKVKVLCYCAKENSSVEALDISNYDITSREAKIIFKALQGSMTLKKLDISHNSISDDGVKAISECLENNYTLQELNASYNQISNNGIINISNALQMNVTLRTLNISQNNICDDGVSAIGMILQNNYMVIGNEIVINKRNTQCILQNLDISCNNITSKGIVALGECLRNNNTLQKLTTSWSDCKSPFMLDSEEKLCNMSNKCFRNIGTILVLGFLFQNSKVQILNLSHNNISDDGAVVISDYIKANTTLKELNISNNKITSHGVIKIAEAITENTTICLLDVSMNNISRSTEVVTALSDCLKFNNTLQVLGISWDDSDTTYVYQVAINNECYVDNKWPRSQWSIFDMVHYVSDHSLKFDKKYNSRTIHNTKKLQPSSRLQFNDTEGIILAALVHGYDNVQTIKIVRSEIFDNAAIIISDFLKTNKTFHKLELSHNTTSNWAIKQIMKAIQINSALQVLDISHNEICDDGAEAISECLKDNNSTLQQLYMSHNQVSNIGITKISEALQINATLQILDISYNIISNDGVIAIGKSLKNYNEGINCILRKLDISYNNVSSHGIVSLSKCLKNNDRLQILIISWKGRRSPIVLERNITFCNMSNNI